MAGTVLELKDVLSEDSLATRITEMYMNWENARELKKQDWEEIRRYVYATDTSQTTNSSLPWKNKTTVPKLCQIRDNLYSNYTATLFPKRKWLIWEADEANSNSKQKRDAIVNYMSWAIEQPSFKHEMDKIILDYIDYGNCFATVEWVDNRVQQADKTQAGYVGPAIRRIDPMSIVANPTAPSFGSAPKIIKSNISVGEVKDMLEGMSNFENRQEMEELYHYLKDIRLNARTYVGDWAQKDRLYQMDGFSSYREYLQSGSVEILTFYGDWYDPDNDTFEKNRVITVIDRHKLICNKPNPSFFGSAPIFHSPWRKKQDNLWGMGPLDNLIGMQYRLDHMENMKADLMDLSTYPVQKVKGFVEDFTWRPGEKIFVSDEGDVELVQPNIQVQQLVQDIMNIMALMEEMAGAPKEAMGFRTPGEKTAYEFKSLENAASRVFQNKINQFEEQVVEPLLNAMLELSKRNQPSSMSIRVINDEFKIATFQNLTVEDITGVGRIKPVAARHFAEKSELVQNLNGLAGSNIWASVSPHVSGIKLSKIYEDVFNMKEYEVFLPYIALAEQADGQRQVQALQEQLHQEMGTATGIGEDFDVDGTVQPPEAPQPDEPIQ